MNSSSFDSSIVNVIWQHVTSETGYLHSPSPPLSPHLARFYRLGRLDQASWVTVVNKTSDHCCYPVTKYIRNAMNISLNNTKRLFIYIGDVAPSRSNAANRIFCGPHFGNDVDWWGTNLGGSGVAEIVHWKMCDNSCNSCVFYWYKSVHFVIQLHSECIECTF